MMNYRFSFSLSKNVNAMQQGHSIVVAVKYNKAAIENGQAGMPVLLRCYHS
jgi:hypothetical protein